MFEKEAEETFRKNYPEYCCGKELLSPYWDLWQEGAEFGFKECAKARLNVTTISDCPIKDEWHDLRKNPLDLPEKMGLGSVEVYVAYEGGVTDFACYRFDKKCWERSEDDEDAVNVIAWREIPLFKEIE